MNSEDRPATAEHALVLDPTMASPSRRPGSVRRTSHLLMTWPGGYGTDLHIEGEGRDLATPWAGPAEVLAGANLAVTISPEREVRSLTLEPGPDHIHELVGVRAGGGFRRALAEAFAAGTDRHPLSYFLIEDLPTAGLISTFALSRQPELLEAFYEVSRRPASQVEGVCSGYRPGGLAIRGRQAGINLDQNIAIIDALEDDGDPLAWHQFQAPSEAAMCRRRRLDVWAESDQYVVDAMFRDNTWEPDGQEAIVHEYGLSATIDAEALTLTSLQATPRVLPYPECPLATDELRRCIGFDITTLRVSILGTLRGIDSCTHLNDMLRSLAELPSLLRHVERRPA